MKKAGIIIQARMNSTRLPAKILMLADGKPFLLHQIERLRQTDIPIFIATTTNDGDAPIVRFCEESGIPCFRGSEDDVLSRYLGCADRFDLSTVIRVTSDCPLIEPVLITEGLAKFAQLENHWAYVSNTITRTYPRGFDFEIFSFEALQDASDHAVLAEDKEHVTPYIWKNKSGLVDVVQMERIGDASSFRLTLDTPEDYTLLNALIAEHHAAKLSGEQIIALLESHPELVSINSHIEQKKIGQ